MQAGELWWIGREESLSIKLDKMAPPCYDMTDVLNVARVKDPGSREGLAFRTDVLRSVEDTMVYYGMWKVCMEAEIAATESSDRAVNAITGLRKAVQSFKGEIKNDLSSMKAASDRVQSEVMQMGKAYKQAADLLITPEFKQAIENAERLATALRAIQDLSATKVSVAVFAGGKNENPTV